MTQGSSYPKKIYESFIRSPLKADLIEDKEYAKFIEFLKEIGAYGYVSDGDWHVLRIFGEVFVDGINISSPTTKTVYTKEG